MNDAGARLHSPASLEAAGAGRWLTHPKFRWFIVVAWAGLIFYLSTSGFGVGFTESLYTSDGPRHLIRKAAHMTPYFLCSFTQPSSTLTTSSGVPAWQ